MSEQQIRDIVEQRKNFKEELVVYGCLMTAKNTADAEFFTLKVESGS